MSLASGYEGLAEGVGEMLEQWRRIGEECKRYKRARQRSRKREIPIHKATASQLAALAHILGWGGQFGATEGPGGGGRR